MHPDIKLFQSSCEHDVRCVSFTTCRIIISIHIVSTSGWRDSPLCQSCALLSYSQPLVKRGICDQSTPDGLKKTLWLWKGRISSLAAWLVGAIEVRRGRLEFIFPFSTILITILSERRSMPRQYICSAQIYAAANGGVIYVCCAADVLCALKLVPDFLARIEMPSKCRC